MDGEVPAPDCNLATNPFGTTNSVNAFADTKKVSTLSVTATSPLLSVLETIPPSDTLFAVVTCTVTKRCTPLPDRCSYIANCPGLHSVFSACCFPDLAAGASSGLLWTVWRVQEVDALSESTFVDVSSGMNAELSSSQARMLLSASTGCDGELQLGRGGRASGTAGCRVNICAALGSS